MLFFFYAIILVCTAAALFHIANFAGVKTQTGTAEVIAKRIVPAHWEWQTRGRYLTRAYVEEYEILDLIVNGRKMTYRPIPWILERTSLSESLCARHKLMAKEPLYATQT
ncbi:hypothetical protein C6Q04_26985 [Burkholderia multivorans]|nr:hypothetical protein C6Q04_26985 [Burkholderia multivorans]PRG48568.1 hypothetical protein C6T63_22790 [Burkholderia multivorans]